MTRWTFSFWVFREPATWASMEKSTRCRMEPLYSFRKASRVSSSSTSEDFAYLTVHRRRAPCGSVKPAGKRKT